MIRNLLPAVLSVLFLSACGETPRQETDAEENLKEAQPVAPPKSIISIADAQADYKSYSERRVPLIQQYEDAINKREGIDSAFAVARYVSFSYADLKQYMAYVEQEADGAGVDIANLRIYFANNADKAESVHPRQNSVFLIPTVMVDNKDFGLYIRDGKPAYLNWEMQRMGENGMGSLLPEGSRAEAGLISLPFNLFEDKSLIMNEGGSGPPPFN